MNSGGAGHERRTAALAAAQVLGASEAAVPAIWGCSN